MDRDIVCLIIADDPLVRAALALLLADTADCHVTGQLSAAAFLTDSAEILADSSAEIALWDMGWAGAGWSAETEPPDFNDLPLPVVALISDPDQAAAAWSAGARAILPRDTDADRLEAAIAAAAQGLLVIDPIFALRLLPTAETSLPIHETLTPREHEVLQLLAEGLTNKALAQRLAISDHTVKFHVNALMSKLNAQSRTEAVVIATRQGLISL